MLDISPITDTASLSTRIYEQLKAAIANMNIYDEDVDLRLDERTLSEQFGSSRTPLPWPRAFSITCSTVPRFHCRSSASRHKAHGVSVLGSPVSPMRS